MREHFKITFLAGDINIYPKWHRHSILSFLKIQIWILICTFIFPCHNHGHYSKSSRASSDNTADMYQKGNIQLLGLSDAIMFSLYIYYSIF